MIKLNQNRIRKLFIPGVFFFLAVMAISINSPAEDVFLTPPGLRPVKDPTLVIPTDYRYPNKLIKLPAYRDDAGNPADGWSDKFVDTRRFVSNQSAWIYFRSPDLQRSVATGQKSDKGVFRFWPVGTTLVIESYKGYALQRRKDKLVEIDVMSKIKDDTDSSAQAFYPVNWTYARFKPDGSPSITSAKVRECHQCHSIAFHLTGDLVFTFFK
ncbi:cytochrome P460 family protein [Thermodesulfobacteriota bacterium]